MDDSFKFTHCEELERLDVATRGPLTVEIHRVMIAEMIRWCRKVEVQSILLDHSEATISGLTPADIRGIAKLCQSLNPVFDGGKFAAVMDRDVDFGMARMWHSLVEGNLTFETRLYRDRSESLEWLDDVAILARIH